MLFNSIIRRRLLSLLHPWLLEEPQLDLELGFFHSLAVVTNLRLDVVLLNKLFHSPPLLFVKDLTVERVVFRFSTWSSPAFNIEFHGVRVVLSLEKPEEEECVKRLRIPKYDYLDDLRKKLSVLDPEGCSLHQILETVLFAVHEKERLYVIFSEFNSEKLSSGGTSHSCGGSIPHLKWRVCVFWGNEGVQCKFQVSG